MCFQNDEVKNDAKKRKLETLNQIKYSFGSKSSNCKFIRLCKNKAIQNKKGLQKIDVISKKG